MGMFLNGPAGNEAVRPNREGLICPFEKDADMPGSSADDRNIIRESEEAKENKGLNCSVKPSIKEVEDHERTHLPYRSWCKHCVRGRAKSTPQWDQTALDEDCEVPTISWDYMYLNDEHEQNKNKNEEELDNQKDGMEGLPILVWADSLSKGAMAFFVPNKGECEYAIKRGEQDVNKILGYRKMNFRGDQEPALRTVLGRIKMLSGDQCTLEDTPVGESKSNGRVEGAKWEIRGLYKTIRSNVETNYGIQLEPSHPIHAWMLRHASATRFRESKGQDGFTAYRRIKGREFKRELVSFGECVWYMKPKSKHKKKGDYSWDEGIWLGIRDESGEYIIGTKDGVIKVRSVRRRGSHEDRWNAEELMEMKGLPWEPVPGRENIEIQTG